MVKFFAVLAGFIFTTSFANDLVIKNESYYNDKFCAEIGGQREVKHFYTTDNGLQGFVLVDCKTEDEVYEGGLNKRSSLDSIQQALFFAAITGKKPAIVLHKSKQLNDKYKFRIQKAAEKIKLKLVLN